MAFPRRQLLAGVCAAVVAPQARAAFTPPRKLVSLADLGARPEADAALLFREALARLGPSGGVLHIPPGIWRFSQTDGVAVDVRGIDDLSIEGHGATLLFSGLVNPIIFTGCHAPSVAGVTVDWTRPPFSQGEVLDVSVGNRSVELLIDAEFPVHGSERVGAIGTYDRPTALMSRGGLDAYDVVDSVTLVGAQRLRLGFTRALRLRAGDTVVLRHAVYAANALSFFRCNELAVEDVTIRTAPGMGIYADHCTGAMVRRLEIARPQGSGRLMTTTADGVHFNACGGQITVANCSMAGMGDDCVNIHRKYFRIVRRVDARTAIVAVSPSVLASPQHATPDGDQLEVVAAKSLRTCASLTVLAAEQSGNGLTILHLNGDLPANIEAGDYVLDAETRSKALVSGCRFMGNRARGVLAHSDSVIERCHFFGQSAEAVLLYPDARFMEGPAAERVIIRENDVADVLRINGKSGAIRIDVGVNSALDTRPINRNIFVIDNRFSDVPGPALFARSTAGLTFSGNRIVGASSPAVVLQDVQDVGITGNVCSPDAKVDVRLEDRNHVTLVGNTGLL